MKRTIRAQTLILQNGKYLLLKHHEIKKARTFWGMPGGGVENGETIEEAAVREAREETGLTIQLLPFRYEYNPTHSKIYDKIVIFLAKPISGEAKLGFEPEEEIKGEWELLDLKWQPLFSNKGIDTVTLEEIKPFRDYVKRGGQDTLGVDFS